VIGAGAALAADEPAEGDGNGAAEPAEPLPEWAARAVEIAQADPRVAAVLAGVEWEPAVTPWGGAPAAGEAAAEGEAAADGPDGEEVPAAPTGAAVVFTWPGAQARSVGAEWPLVRSLDGDEPAPPYEVTEHRLRIETLSALQVDVLVQDERVLQLVPLDGETRFDLREETWPPFSWVPFFTERPWLPAPFLLALGAVVTIAAWRRSRAWNRRSPSMTRHDRQFIGRLGVVVFLLGGLAWQVYEGYRAATYPAIDTGGVNAGELVALPMLLLPPALFVAGIALELSSGSHRVAWGLLAVLCAAGSAYNLAVALTGTVTNLNLSAYLLLAVLAILAVPRAFSSGKMGWSRSATPAVY
jgi:hypothetical protein